MGARERWVFKEGDKYIEHSENDGWAFINSGAEAREQVLTDKETIRYLEDQLSGAKRSAMKPRYTNGV